MCKNSVSAKILIYQPIRNFIQCSPVVLYTSLTLKLNVTVQNLRMCLSLVVEFVHRPSCIMAYKNRGPYSPTVLESILVSFSPVQFSLYLEEFERNTHHVIG